MSSWQKVHHEMAVAVARQILKELRLGKGIGYAESMQLSKALVELDDRGVQFLITPYPDAISAAADFLSRRPDEKTVEDFARAIEAYATTREQKALERAAEIADEVARTCQSGKFSRVRETDVAREIANAVRALKQTNGGSK